jgi:hypothetical protein
MADGAITEDKIVDLTNRLNSHLPWVRSSAAAELVGVDFEQLERPPQVSLLLATLNVTELRHKAMDSLTRVLTHPDNLTPAQIGSQECAALRAALDSTRPDREARFQAAAAHALLAVGDTNAIRVLKRLVRRTDAFIRFMSGNSGRDMRVWSVEARASDVRHARTTAFVAYERLRLLAEVPAPGGTLLRRASAPEKENKLLRPAAASQSDPRRLLRPEPDRSDES